jgi:ornithine cyclodeaminase/alanine dehydrogenase-like protein (mu-crystallin family)
MDECIDAVERAFRLHAEGRSIPPGVLSAHTDRGAFHVKTGGIAVGDGSYFATKVNANLPGNRERFGLPTIQGVIALFDVENGYPLALIDSGEITSVRTAAATAVAARYLARTDAAVVTICGCGVQGRDQLRAIACVRQIRSVFAIDAVADRAEAYAEAMSRELGIAVRAVHDLARAARESDICVTCTTARRAILHPGDVSAGAFVAAVGADNPEKQEIDPALLATSVVVTDVLEQAATIGDLHHALAAGVMTRADVRAELGAIVAGRAPGRTSPDETIIFDSTGTALQDVAAAAVVYERASARGRGLRIELGA